MSIILHAELENNLPKEIFKKGRRRKVSHVLIDVLPWQRYSSTRSSQNLQQDLNYNFGKFHSSIAKDDKNRAT